MPAPEQTICIHRFFVVYFCRKNDARHILKVMSWAVIVSLTGAMPLKGKAVETWVAENLWIGLTVWTILYISDYMMTIACARMYHAGVREKIAFEGSFELNPYFQKDVTALRSISPRFILALAFYLALLAALWFLTREIAAPNAMYLFPLGALLLMELAVHVRHIRNFVLFRGVLVSGGVQGRIEYSRLLSLRVSLAEFLAFAVLFLLVGVVTESWFVLGGAAGCLSLAGHHRRWIRKHAKKKAQEVQPADASEEPGGTGMNAEGT